VAVDDATALNRYQITVHLFPQQTGSRNRFRFHQTLKQSLQRRDGLSGDTSGWGRTEGRARCPPHVRGPSYFVEALV